MDGTEYVITGDGVMNYVFGYKSADVNYEVFNRLVDTDQIKSLVIKGSQWTEDMDSDERVEFDRIYVPAE